MTFAIVVGVALRLNVTNPSRPSAKRSGAAPTAQPSPLANALISAPKLIASAIPRYDVRERLLLHGALGVLSMLVAYVVTNLGAMKFLHLERREPVWRVIVPILALAALVYTLYKNLWPRPAHPYNLFPYIIAGWLAVGIAITLAFPRLARRIGRNLSEAEGITGAES